MLRAALFMAVLAGSAMANTAPVPPSATPDLPSAQAVEASLRPVARRLVIPEARWDHRPGARRWTLSALASLRAHASVLPEIVPQDIAEWCPAYPTAPQEQREAFWVGLLSTLAKHESTYRPTAVGGGGRWYGLVQIYPPTARLYKCRARSGDALKNPSDNLSCALRIMARTVNRDKVVSRGMRGVAADWGPFHSRRKRSDMMEWTRSQDYCKGLNRSLRPVARPLLQDSDPAEIPPRAISEG